MRIPQFQVQSTVSSTSEEHPLPTARHEGRRIDLQSFCLAMRRRGGGGAGHRARTLAATAASNRSFGEESKLPP